MIAVASPDVEVRVPRPLPHQRPIIDAPKRFKVWRGGRRVGKTRAELHCALFGHGPNRIFKGLVHGKDVGWVAPDYTQADIVWLEDIKPRFEGVEGWTLSEKHHSVTWDGRGTLFLISFENIRALRGRGKRLGGVVIDEGAHFNLRYAWRSVIRPTLMDCEGWAIFGSTTNSGPDGYTDENGQRTVPSFFNTLCNQIMGGVRGEHWGHWHSDARSNPVISKSEFAELEAEYADGGETALQEEVYAALLHGGAGLAFPEWSTTMHVRSEEPDSGDTCAAGMDWGHGTPGWIGFFYTRPNNRLLLRKEYYFKRERAKKIGYKVGIMCLASPCKVEHIALDEACFSVTGVGATIAEKLQEGLNLCWQRRQGGQHIPQFVAAPKGKEAVRTQTMLLHEVLGFDMDADAVVVEPPVLSVHPDCRDFCRTIAKLPLDPRDPNKFDTKGEDHPAQGAAYYLVLRAPEFRPPKLDPETIKMRERLDVASKAEAESMDRLEKELTRPRRRRLMVD